MLCIMVIGWEYTHTYKSLVLTISRMYDFWKTFVSYTLSCLSSIIVYNIVKHVDLINSHVGN